MTLKKSDKIIAIIGVIILIVAAVGIYVYAGVEEEKKPIKEEEESYYEIFYEERTLTVMPDNTDYSIKPKLVGQGSYDGMFEITQPNIKSIEINIEYSDNKVGFLPRLHLIKKIGADTITVTIYDSMDSEIDGVKIKGSGNETLFIKTDGDMISMEPIEADNIMDAMSILEERYIDYSETYTIHISLKTGLWGKIRELLGKDKFMLDITYCYYDYYIVEKVPGDNSDGNGDMPPTGESQGSQTWSPMAYPGKN